jgi:hypothetical protein
MGKFSGDDSYQRHDHIVNRFKTGNGLVRNAMALMRSHKYHDRNVWKRKRQFTQEYRAETVMRNCPKFLLRISWIEQRGICRTSGTMAYGTKR